MQAQWIIFLLTLAFQQHASQAASPEANSSNSTTPRITGRLNIKSGYVKCYNNERCYNNGDCMAFRKNISIFHCRWEADFYWIVIYNVIKVACVVNIKLGFTTNYFAI